MASSSMNTSESSSVYAHTVATTSLPLSTEEESNYVLSSLAVVFILLGATAICLTLVLLMLRKRRIDRLRHHLLPLYNFDATDDQEDWETELLDDIPESHSLQKGYKSMEFPSTRGSSTLQAVR